MYIRNIPMAEKRIVCFQSKNMWVILILNMSVLLILDNVNTILHTH